MNDYFEFKNKIQEIIKAWTTIIKPGIEESGKYGETNTRKYLIDPVLEALNWVDDGSKKIVDNEFAIKHKTGTGSADYALKVNDSPKILVEAKDVAKVKDLENGYDIVHGIKRTYPRQLSNYCHDLNHQGFDIKFSILTNGKEWIVYNMQYADISSEREIIFRLKLDELDKDDNIRKLWALEYNDICGDYHRLREIIQQLHDFRLDIDKKAVQQLLECKDLLSNSIFNDYEANKRGIKDQIDEILQDKVKFNGMPTFQEINEADRFNFFIKEASSSIINKILFIRILEDKNFLTPKLTKRSIEKWRDFFGYKDYDEIMNLFRESCRISEKTYNGGLFKLNPYDKIEYDPIIIKKIIDKLGNINFREIDSDIIGRIYEIYLGQVLKVESEIRGKKRIKYKADNRQRKKLGQYYTPNHVVDYIVKNTLGKLIKGKKPEQISKIRILDPACGSGSFLIKAYDVLAEYFENWNNEILKKIHEKNKKQGAKITNYSDTGAVPKYKNIILKDNLHGVDLNDLSVQICEINLWLRALERDKKLVKLNKNILHGNSLITGIKNEEELSEFKKELDDIKKRQHQIKEYYDEDEISRSEEKRLEALEKNLKYIKKNVNEKLNENLKDYFDDHINNIKPFNWNVEFPEVMQEGGYDIVIGNPPWGAKFSNEIISYLKEVRNLKSMKFKNTDSYLTFIEIVFNLLKKDGVFAFIVPDTFLRKIEFSPIREFILKKYSIKSIIEIGNVFEETKGVEDVIFIFERKMNKDSNYFEHSILSKHRSKDERLEMISKNQFDLSAKEDQRNIMKNYANRFGYIPGEKHQHIINKIEETGIKLGEIKDVQISRGSEGGKKLIISHKKDDSYYPILIPDDVNRYRSNFSERYFPIKGSRAKYENDKILIIRIRNQKLKDRIIASLDNKKMYCLKTLQMIYLNENSSWDLKGIVGILNSKLINYYCKYFLADDMNKEYLKAIPIINVSKNEEFLNLVDRILYLKNNYFKIQNEFRKALSNQPIKEAKSCNFSSYFDGYELYNIKRKTFNEINQRKAKILSVRVKEVEEKLNIFVTIDEESDKQLSENLKAIELKIKDEDIRKFLYLSIKKAIHDKKGKTFGKGNILKIIKKLNVPLFITNAESNIKKIKNVMEEFRLSTNELWGQNGSKNGNFSSLDEMESEIEKIDKKIDEMVYELYNITDEEKEIIENGLKLV